MAPILVTLVSFYHFAVIRGQTLTPSIAFTSVYFPLELGADAHRIPPQIIGMKISHLTVRTVASRQYLVFNELKFALSALPSMFISMLQVRERHHSIPKQS